MHERFKTGLFMVIGVLLGIGAMGLWWTGDDDGPATAEDFAFDGVTTTLPTTEVLGIQIENTTTTAPAARESVAPTTSTSTAGATTTTTVGRSGRLYGTLYPSNENETTIVRLQRGTAVVNEMETDAAGKWEFTNVAPGTYTLTRTTSTAPNCSSTTTITTACVGASSTSMTDVELKPGEQREVAAF